MAEFALAALALATGVFSTSAISKLRRRTAYREFRAGLRATRLIPERLTNRAAILLVAVEGACAAGLTGAVVLAAARFPGAGSLAQAGLGAATMLTALLTAGVAIVVMRGTVAHCPCFGATSSEMLDAAHLVRTACLLFLLAGGLACCMVAHADASLAGSALAVICGLVAALLFIRWDDLAALFRSPRQDRVPR